MEKSCSFNERSLLYFPCIKTLTDENISLILSLNETFNQSNIPLTFKYVISFFSVFICILGIIGSMLIFYTIKNKKHRNNTDYYVLNLATTDLLLSVFYMPTVNVLYLDWPFGSPMCPILSYIFAVFVLQRSLIITAITIDRHHGMSKLMIFQKKRIQVKFISILSWTFACLFCIPILFYSQIVNTYSESGSHTLCIEMWPHKNYKIIYNLSTLLLQYILPVSVMAVLYTHVACIIWRNKTPGEANLRRDCRIRKRKLQVYTLKHAHSATSVKQPPAIKGKLFLSFHITFYVN